MKKLGNTEAELEKKKGLLIKKCVFCNFSEFKKN